MKREIVTVTEAAKNYLNDRCDGGKYLVGIKINNRGCSGHSYEYSLVDPAMTGPMDETITWSGGGLTIAATSVMFMLGSTLDLKTTIMESYLQWENPQTTDPCGCGTSFGLSP